MGLERRIKGLENRLGAGRDRCRCTPNGWRVHWPLGGAFGGGRLYPAPPWTDGHCTACGLPVLEVQLYHHGEGPTDVVPNVADVELSWSDDLSEHPEGEMLYD